MHRSLYIDLGKPILDRAVALAGLLVLSPVLAGLACTVRLKLGRPVIFRQERPGMNGRPFTMFKFRTMTDAVDGSGVLLPDADRLTNFGRFLRSTSLDELPELWNVLRGEMSLVGPRPLLMRYLDRYTSDQYRRHEVLPGITGLAQVKGRNTLSWAEKFELDVEYVDNVSLGLDLKILSWTILNVLRRNGVSAVDHVTMPEFMGVRDE